MSEFRFGSALDELMFVVVILAGVAVAAAMEVGALRSTFEHKAVSIAAQARAAGGSAGRLVAAWVPRHVPGTRPPAKIGG